MNDLNSQLAESTEAYAQTLLSDLIVQLCKPIVNDTIISFLQYELMRLLAELEGGADSTEVMFTYTTDAMVERLQALVSISEDMFEVRLAHNIIRSAEPSLLALLLATTLKKHFSDTLAITTRDGVTVESLIFS